jgi:hypothetical protein
MSKMTTDVSISGFISKLKNGLARPNRFIVEFVLPRGVSDFKSGMNSNVQSGQISQQNFKFNGDGTVNVFCHTCSLPQRSLLTYTHRQLSSPYRVPYSQQEYDPVSFMFYADSELNTRRFFDIWQTAVVNTAVNTMNYYNEFTTGVTIKVLNDEGEPGYSVVLYECYPISVGMVDLSYSTANQVMSVMVTMSYKQWSDPDTNRTDLIPK